MVIRPSRSGASRLRALALCLAPIVALLAVVALAPLPFSVAQPGQTTDVLGTDGGKDVIALSGAPVRRTSGELRMTAIAATGPQVRIGLREVVGGWFRGDRAVMPKDSVFPSGGGEAETARHNAAQMRTSQHAAVRAALGHLGKDPRQITVKLRLAGVGGPSAGLLFSLGIVDKLAGDGHGGDLTGGRRIAGTGTIDADGTVGPVGGAPLKTQAAARDGAQVFLIPRANCAEVTEPPAGLRLIPVTSLKSAVTALRTLKDGGRVPAC